MSIDIPDLDDSSYDELLENARRQIPARAESWTDHNAHDPGITFLELFAWLAETYGYQLDRVTDTHRLKYLKLLGERPRPPVSAEASLKIHPSADVASVRLPPGTALEVEDDRGAKLAFQTAEPVTVTDARVESIVSDHRRGRTDVTQANATDGLYFLAFGPVAEAGSVMYLGIDDDPFAVGTHLDLCISFHDDDLPPPAVHGDETPTFEPTVELSWEYLTNYQQWYSDTAWEPLDVASDGTNQLYRGGRISLAKPNGWRPDNWDVSEREVLDQRAGLYWIRCMVTTAGYEIPPQLSSVSLNVVTARHRTTVVEDPLHRLDGGTETTALPSQRFELTHTPVAAPEETRVVGGGEKTLSDSWMPVPDFDASGPDDAHYVLNPAEGTVTFGIGPRGRIPPPGRTVAASYVAGGGQQGNVSESADWTFVDETPLGEGTYTYYCATHREVGMTGMIVVGDPPDEPAGSNGNGDDGSTIGILDERGSTTVTIEVGVTTDDNVPGFSPAAVRIDPGTRVRFIWVTDGHTVVVENQPPGGDWPGHPTPEPAGFEYERVFTVVMPCAIGVDPLTAASGGRDAESISDTLARVKRELRTRYRAISLADYREVALNTPGLRFGRANATVVPTTESPVNVDGRQLQCEEHGRVRVVVVPYSTLSAPKRPIPSEGFLEAVQCHLNRHRLLTDRLTVEAPTYVGVAVDVEARASPDRRDEDVESAITNTLETFLDPLDGYEGEGWPFGRPVFVSEIYEVLERQTGIDCVLDVALAPRAGGSLDGAGNVRFDAAALPYLADTDVAVRVERDRCDGGV
ncbi:putative baseplate assembly protein [Halalkalicoccus salilacus]|uniref:putative baseplate assembly protein n=1 Tax=Halalkalicoccus salilacus TaxID=3117459 RepID=UPI00300F2EB3